MFSRVGCDSRKQYIYLMRGLVYLILLAPTAALLLPTRPGAAALQCTSRRNALASGFACGVAAIASPIAAAAKLGDGCPSCQENKELETSPLIEELKRRTEANKEKNAAIVKETLSFNGGIVDEEIKMVRYQGVRICVFSCLPRC